jgi:hypothetical protein
VETQGAHAILLTGNPPHGAKPNRQRQMTVLEDGSCADRHLIAAMLAKPARPTNQPGLGHIAPWTDPSAGPAQCRKVFDTSIVAAESPFQLEHRPGKIHVHAHKIYILGSAASSKYRGCVLRTSAQVPVFLTAKQTRLVFDCLDLESLEIAARRLVFVVSAGRFLAFRDTTPLDSLW